MRPQLAPAAMIAASIALSMPAQSAPPANPQMQEVLDAHASLKPKPITELSAPEARKQPSPADGVKALLKKKGMSTAPEAVGKVENRTIDEFLFRDAMRAEILASVGEQQAELAGTLRDAHHAAIDRMASSVGAALDRAFIPARDGLGGRDR